MCASCAGQLCPGGGGERQDNIESEALGAVFLVPELCDGVNSAFLRLMRDDQADRRVKGEREKRMRENKIFKKCEKLLIKVAKSP